MANPDLYSDLFFQILTRVSSFQTLATCRLVCKEWNKMTYESKFINLHRQRTNTVSGYFVQSRKSDLYSSVFVHYSNPDLSLDLVPVSHPIKIEASSSQGILFCYCQNSRTYFVYIPSTKQWRYVPNGDQDLTESTALMVIKLNPLQFKIIKLSTPVFPFSPTELCYNRETETFDSNTRLWTYHWHGIKFSCDEVLDRSPPVTASGGVHWLTNKKNVIRFGQENESLRMISPPPEVKKGYGDGDDVQIVNFEGKLGLIGMKSGNQIVEIWVMEIKGLAELWKKRKTVKITELDDYDDIIMVKKLKVLYKNDETVYPFKSDEIHNKRLLCSLPIHFKIHNMFR